MDRDGSTAIERQELECRAWVDRNGLEVRTIHVDRGVSGFKNVTRKGFDAAIAALTSGVVGTLVVWKVDRLSRRGMGQVGAVLDSVERVGGPHRVRARRPRHLIPAGPPRARPALRGRPDRVQQYRRPGG